MAALSYIPDLMPIDEGPCLTLSHGPPGVGPYRGKATSYGMVPEIEPILPVLPAQPVEGEP